MGLEGESLAWVFGPIKCAQSRARSSQTKQLMGLGPKWV